MKNINNDSYMNSCGHEEYMDSKMCEAIAMAYVPWQKFRELNNPTKALQRGTIFKELDKPFLGCGGKR